MQPFRVHHGKAAPLERANVNTDQIIPKQFLKRIERTGFGEFLFHDWRRDAEFSLNQPQYSGASILVAGKNFGCGSSREHAVWALADFGFRAVIAPSFADIFANNCIQNGVLTVVLSEADIREIFRRIEGAPGYQLTIDLEKSEVRDGQGLQLKFGVEPTTRHRLLHGFDDIGITLQDEAAIAAYEAEHPVPARQQL